MEIGHRLFYDATSGLVLCDTGERSVDVVTTTPADDMAAYPQLAGRTAANTGSVDYAYGDVKFNGGYATAHIDPATQALTLFPWAKISASSGSVASGGTLTITVSGLSTPDGVNFSVDGGAGTSVTPSGGTATFSFTSVTAGDHVITAVTAKNGTARVTVTVN